jgi:hypothetical protein
MCGSGTALVAGGQMFGGCRNKLFDGNKKLGKTPKIAKLLSNLVRIWVNPDL